MTEAQRKQLNAERLLKIDPSIRPKVEAVVADLESHGEKPLIAEEVWRDPALQLKKFKQGVSKLKWGFHCATDAKNKPASLAADIVDADKMWNASPRFWLLLGACALAHGLNWGGFFGLPANMKAALQAAIKAKQWDTRTVKFGWDVAHVETAAVSVAEAKAGKR